MKKYILALAVFATGASSDSGGSCGGTTRPPPITNWSFDRWDSEDALSSWETERGSIERTATWHEKDRGVSLVGESVVISQLGFGANACTRFDFVTLAEAGVEARFRIDYGDDGTFEVDESLAKDGDWTALRYDVAVNEEQAIPVRYVLTKSGGNRFLIGQARGRIARDCSGKTITLSPPVKRSSGSICYDHNECLSRRCVDDVCD